MRTAKLKPGNVITELEGHDLGADGAVVMKVLGDEVKLVRVDNEEVVTISIEDLDYAAEEPKSPDIQSSWYDQETFEQGPKPNPIRWLPTYWGPKDPNAPSTMTDVTWRPQDWYRRWQQRYYHTQESLMRTPLRKSLTPRRGFYQKDPVPTPPDHRSEPYHQNYVTPSRVRLQRWRRDDALLPTEDLLHLTKEFWEGYWRKRNTYMPQHGNRINLQAKDWGLMFQQRTGLSRDEMLCLYEFMVETDLVPTTEKQMFEDLLDTFAVHLFHQI